MAITENTFTADELEAVVTANPAIIDQINSYTTKTGGYFAPNAAKKTEYESNIKSTLTSDIATKNERMVEELSGIKKAKADQKWYEYGGEVIKTLSAKEKQLSTELTTLRGQANLTDAEKARITQLEGIVASKDGEVTTLKTEHQKEISRLKAENKIYSSISSVDAKMKKTPELQEAIQIVREKVLADMTSSAVDREGKIVFLKEDKSYYTNGDGTLMTPDQLYSFKMDKYIDKGIVVTGGGGNGEGPDDQTIAPGQFKSQYEIDTYLGKKGMISGTTEFIKERKRLGADKLPLSL